MPTSSADNRSGLLHRQIARRDRISAWVRRALIFATACVIVNSLFGDAGLAAKMRARRNYAVAEDQLRRLRNENAGLRQQVRRLESDTREIEDVARKELGLIRPGEVIFVVKTVR
jgi:cell division protein FtsB